MVNFFAVCGCCTRTDIVREHLEDTLRICDVSAMGLYDFGIYTSMLMRITKSGMYANKIRITKSGEHAHIYTKTMQYAHKHVHEEITGFWYIYMSVLMRIPKSGMLISTLIYPYWTSRENSLELIELYLREALQVTSSAMANDIVW